MTSPARGEYDDEDTLPEGFQQQASGSFGFSATTPRAAAESVCCNSYGLCWGVSWSAVSNCNNLQSSVRTAPQQTGMALHGTGCSKKEKGLPMFEE